MKTIKKIDTLKNERIIIELDKKAQKSIIGGISASSVTKTVKTITGTYFAGLFLGQTEYKVKVHEGISTLGKSFFVDVFFVGIGLEFDLLKIETEPLIIISFIVLAIVGKIIGSWIGARINGFDNVRSLRIGIGMVPRGEVALIVANMAVAKNLISSDFLSATILMVITSAIFTPLMLKFSFTKIGSKGFK